MPDLATLLVTPDLVAEAQVVGLLLVADPMSIGLRPWLFSYDPEEAARWRLESAITQALQLGLTIDEVCDLTVALLITKVSESTPERYERIHLLRAVRDELYRMVKRNVQYPDEQPYCD